MLAHEHLLRSLGVFWSAMWWILREERVFSCHLQRMVLLQPNDCLKRIKLAQRFTQQGVIDHSFSDSDVFIDKASFSHESEFNAHNLDL